MNQIESGVDPKRILIEVLLLTAACGLASGGIYYYRTNFLELSSLGHNIFRVVRMTLIYLLIPLLYFVLFRKFKLEELGITQKKLVLSVALGLGVYAIALLTFILSIGNPDFDRYFSWSKYMTASEFIATIALIAWMAAVTDIWTRGMVLMPVLKLHGMPLALLAQNIVWFGSHIYELEFLKGSLTLAGAVALTLALGLLGDLVVIKTRNIIGLSAGHIALNLIFFSYIRII